MRDTAALKLENTVGDSTITFDTTAQFTMSGCPSFSSFVSLSVAMKQYDNGLRRGPLWYVTDSVASLSSRRQRNNCSHSDKQSVALKHSTLTLHNTRSSYMLNRRVNVLFSTIAVDYKISTPNEPNWCSGAGCFTFSDCFVSFVKQKISG